MKLSDRTLELDKLPSRELSLEMNDPRALREFSSDDRPPGTPAATGRTAEKRRLRLDAKSSGARSPVVSTAFLKWLLERLTRSKGGWPLSPWQQFGGGGTVSYCFPQGWG